MEEETPGTTYAQRAGGIPRGRTSSKQSWLVSRMIEAQQQMKITPQSLAKKVMIAFPSVSDVQETLRCFRQNLPDGFGFDAPRGQVSLRLKPLRDQAANE
eukprot:3857845-Pyramimonas_sp.AAC.1